MRLYHFSEDPTIEVFDPHIPPTNPDHAAAVWAIDEGHAPLYWFPRDCPRGTVWAKDEEQAGALRSTFLTTSTRLHVTELAWLERIRSTELFAYEFDPEPFERWHEAGGQWIAHDPVEPTAVHPVGDLLDRHVDADIELRLVSNLWPFWDQVLESGLPFSGVRLSNAEPRPN